MLTLGLTQENMGHFENQDFGETIRYLEELDDSYYGAIPSLHQLAAIYGDLSEDRFYSERDLYLKYQRRYIQDHELKLPDMNDERFCCSRLF